MHVPVRSERRPQTDFSLPTDAFTAAVAHEANQGNLRLRLQRLDRVVQATSRIDVRHGRKSGSSTRAGQPSSARTVPRSSRGGVAHSEQTRPCRYRMVVSDQLGLLIPAASRSHSDASDPSQSPTWYRRPKKPTWWNARRGTPPRRFTRHRASRHSRVAPYLVIRLRLRYRAPDAQSQLVLKQANAEGFLACVAASGAGARSRPAAFATGSCSFGLLV